VDAPVIIVGGGPVGLSLALGLARYDTRSIVLERNAEPVRESRAGVIWPRTQEILRDWGAYELLRAAGRFVRALQAVNARTQAPIATVDFGEVEDVFEDPGALMIPQNATESILRELVASNPLCDLRTGTNVTGLAQDADGVDLFCEGPQDAARLRASFVAGCDGSRGVVRSTLGLSLVGVTYDSRVVLSDEIVDTPLAGDLRARPDLPGLRLAVAWGDRRWRVVASIPSEIGDEEALAPRAHHERLRDLFGNEPVTTEWCSVFKVHRRQAERFVVGRVVLAGDAAHLNSPGGGQGMNAGIHDVANLAWKLALAVRNDRCAAALLESYDLERRGIITDTVERFTDSLSRIGIHFPLRAKQFAVRAFSRAVRAHGMQRKLCRGIGMLSGRYTNSPIVDNRHPLAGKRLDDLRLTDGSRLSARRAAEAAIVVVGDFRLDLPHLNLPAAPRRWHVKAPVVLIVRPDGCVAAVVEKPTLERVERAWRRAFCGALPLPVLA